MQKNSVFIVLGVLVIVIGLGVWLGAGQQAGEQASVGNSTSTATTTDYFRDHDDPLAGTTTDYYADNEDVEGYVSVPDDASSTNKKPGIILVHEWWGLNEDIKQMADDYADEGYVALAVDMYGQPPTSSSTIAQQRSQRVRENMDEAMNNLSAGVAYLESRSDVDNARLATVGWCFGGGWAYQMAVNDIGVDASVMYYGQFNPEDDFENMRASILGHFGEEDSVVDVSNAREFKAELEQADQSNAVYIYPNVGHSFANYQGGDNLDYDPEAAETAWNRTLDFLSQQLDGEPDEGNEGNADMSQSEETTDIENQTDTNDQNVSQDDQEVDDGTTDESGQNGSSGSSVDATVRYTNDGFAPQEVSIDVGDTVQFVNEGGQSMWVASDVHPTHTEYSGTSLQEHCGQEGDDAFDQCESGDTYTFTFDKAGEWSYHNHDRATDGGVITVN
jgi:carboxymethylenebutenolidase